jgi:8-oxo-dGTP diphosphatase
MSKKKKMKQSAVVGIVVGNEILILKRQYRENKSNGWCLPGGKLEPGETSIQGAMRETFEETGITIPEPIYVCELISGNKEFIVSVYHIEMDKKDPVTLSIREHSEYAWVKLTDLHKYDLSGNTSLFCRDILSKYI